jgi:tripartite-type tricarboxylate transporter receptor subunit TctC
MKILRNALVVVVLALHSGLAPAQAISAYPTRMITIVAPFAAGTAVDLVIRTVGSRLAERWQQPVVIDNRTGATGSIGADLVARSAPNGYTLLYTTNNFVIAPTLYKNLPYDPIRDFAPVAKVLVGNTLLIVNIGNMPAKDLAEFLSLARSKPGQFNYATSGVGTPFHLAMELMKLNLGLDVVHVPYKDQAGATNGLAGGQVNLMVSATTLAGPTTALVKAGKLRILAVTGTGRHPSFPDVPTFREQGIDSLDVVDIWHGVFAPVKVPPELIARLNQEVNIVLNQSDVHDAITRMGFTPSVATPQEFAALVRSDFARWPKVVSAARITAE